MPKPIKLVLWLCCACAVALIFLVPKWAMAESSRKLPVRYHESTATSAAEITAWISATSGDMVTPQYGEVLNVVPGTYGMPSITFAAGAGNTSADYFRVIRTAPGYGRQKAYLSFASGVYQASKFQVQNEDYLGIYDLEIDGWYACWCAGLYITNSIGVKIVGNTFDPMWVVGGCGWPNNRINQVELHHQTRPTGAIIVNNIFYGLDNDSPAADTASVIFGLGCESLYLYNNTFVGNKRPGYFYFSGDETVLCYNNIRTGNVSDDYATSGVAGEYSVSNDATSGIVFFDAAENDYHITSAATGAINLALDLSEDAAFPFNDDFDGQTRPPGVDMWDIGADEILGLVGQRVIMWW